MNDINASINLDGVRPDQIKPALNADIQEELTHALSNAKQIKTIGGLILASVNL